MGGGAAVDVGELVDALGVSITVFDREARLVYMNDAAVRPFGKPRSELLGRRPWELVPPSKEKTPFRLALEEVLAGSPGKMTVSFVPGLERWYEVDLAAHPLGALAISRDVTTSYSAMRELQKSEERFRAMVESAPEAIVIFDASTGRFCDANSVAEALFAKTREELLASTPLDMCPPTQPDGTPTAKTLATHLARLLEGEAVDFELATYGPNGTSMLVELRARTLPSTSPVLVRTSIFDISKRKRIQEEFAQMQKLEAIARLAGGVAHDFNNLLTVIMGGTQLALASLPSDGPAREDLANVMNAAERAALVTRQLLAFGRKQETVRRPLDLTAYVDRMFPVLQRLVGEDVEVELELARPLASTLADPAQVEQILLNLAANARDAMPKGGRLVIHTANVFLDGEYQRLHNGVPPGRYVMLSVSDTGAGIPEAVKPHIFEPFFTTKAHERGTGLGLATVHGIVTNNDGHIWVYSEPGLGATFKIYLPIIDGPASLDVTAEAPSEHRGTETVLVVEDEESVRVFLRRSLQRSGYTILEARNAGDALLICEQHEGPIHLLLTDVVMPRMTGPQLADRLRALRPDMKIVYISGYSEERVGPPTATSLHDGFISKPMTVEQLLSVVRNVLEGR